MRGWGAALGGERHRVRDVEVIARAPPVCGPYRPCGYSASAVLRAQGPLGLLPFFVWRGWVLVCVWKRVCFCFFVLPSSICAAPPLPPPLPRSPFIGTRSPPPSPMCCSSSTLCCPQPPPLPPLGPTVADADEGGPGVTPAAPTTMVFTTLVATRMTLPSDAAAKVSLVATLGQLANAASGDVYGGGGHDADGGGGAAVAVAAVNDGRVGGGYGAAGGRRVRGWGVTASDHHGQVGRRRTAARPVPGVTADTVRQRDAWRIGSRSGPGGSCLSPRPVCRGGRASWWSWSWCGDGAIDTGQQCERGCGCVSWILAIGSASLRTAELVATLRQFFMSLSHRTRTLCEELNTRGHC